MAVTPKAGRASQRVKKASTTLSATEALQAAEAAIAAPVDVAPKAAEKPAAKAAPQKPAPVKTPQASQAPKPAAPAAAEPEPSPVAVIAATTAVDAAPEPTPETVDAHVAPAPEPAAPTVTQPLPGGISTMNDMMETGKKFAEDTKAKFETVYTEFNEKAKANVEKSTKAIEELSDIAKGNVEAMVESGKIAAKAFETIGQEAVDYSRKSFERATATMKSFSTVKTPTEFFQLQSQLMSSSFDELTKEAAKNSEAMLKLAGDVAQPLTARVTVVTDKVKSLAV